MSDATTHLLLPYILAAQAQKHVAHNEALRLLEDEKCTIFMGVPTMYIGLLEAAKTSDLRPQLSIALSGGAALPLAVLEEFKEVFGTYIYEGYGLTETSPVATFNQPLWEPKPGTVGKAIWGVEVEVAKADVDDRIELLPPGELGEIVIRGHNIFKGYLNKPEATAEAIVDGWFRSGDLGDKDSDGYVRILDRKKDMVVRGGYNVYPRDVEEVLLRHPGVGQVAVIGLPDEQYGEEVVACVVAEGELSEQDRAEMSDLMRRTQAKVQARLSWDKLEPMLRRVYMQVFSKREVDAMVAFYGSADGRSILRKSPQAMALTMQEMQPIMQEMMADLKTDLDRELANRKP